MRLISGLLSLLLLVCPRTASSQSFVLHGSAGPTLVDTGYSFAGGIGFSPTSHLTVSFDAERTHLSSRLRSDGRGGFTGFRGGDRYEDFALPFFISEPIPATDFQGEFWPDGRPNRF